MGTSDPRDRLLNDKPWRHYRRRYSTREAKTGALVLIGLSGVAIWVAWMGAHPDPELFEAAPAQASRTSATAAEGPLPEDLTGPGWDEGTRRAYGPDDVYEKINGREGYYKSFGFRALYSVDLATDAEPSRSIEIELYDQGSVKNALGAYAGELAPEATPEWRHGGFVHYTSNALFMARGPYYVRALGSDRSEAVKAQLERLEARFSAELPAGELPGAYRLFAALDLGPGRISFVKENAFSFEFASEVWVGLWPDDETELFVTQRRRKELDEQFREGFGQYGEPTRGDDGETWFIDRYLGRASAVRASDRFVYGVRGAESPGEGRRLLDRLEDALASEDLELGRSAETEATKPVDGYD